MQTKEKTKKLIIISISLILFGISYYYYTFKQIKFHKKPIFISEYSKKVVLPLRKVISKESISAHKTAKIDDKKNKKGLKNITKRIKKDKKSEKKIKPTDKSELIKIASGIKGKNDPFSYDESRFNPFMTRKRSHSGANYSRINNLPSPPALSGHIVPKNKPDEYIEIKGFLGNKVLIDVNGFTDSLGAGETLRGIKVISIDSQNLSCEFDIKGKKVTKTMKPIIQQNKNAEIKYISN